MENVTFRFALSMPIFKKYKMGLEAVTFCYSVFALFCDCTIKNSTALKNILSFFDKANKNSTDSQNVEGRKLSEKFSQVLFLSQKAC